MKQCSKCKEIKDYSEFGKTIYMKNGFRSQCKKCETMNSKKWNNENPEKCKLSRKKLLDENPEKYKLISKNSKLKYSYGITLEQYDQMIIDQDNKCAICGEFETCCFKGKIIDLSVDHDHKTGKIRGLLCTNCNTSLGGFRDDSTILKKAIHYLVKYK